MKEDDVCTCTIGLNPMCLRYPDFTWSFQRNGKPEEKEWPEETDKGYDGDVEEYGVFRFT
jgi:hypothetical protein